MILGPGTYDPYPSMWSQPTTRASPAFANKVAQRANSSRSIAADLEYDQSNLKLSSSMGDGLQKWTASPRDAPYFDTRPRHRELMPGLDEFRAMEFNSMARHVQSVPRRYAASFSSKLPRTVAPKSDNSLGPGSYDVHLDCACGGIRAEESYSPSRVFAPQVGGRY